MRSGRAASPLCVFRSSAIDRPTRGPMPRSRSRSDGPMGRPPGVAIAQARTVPTRVVRARMVALASAFRTVAPSGLPGRPRGAASA